MIREFAFIQMLIERFGEKAPGLIRGIGDDCAHLEPPQGVVQLITTDVLTHGVHFSSRYITWSDIGFRSVAVNLSDLAASGADPSLPIHLFLSLAVPHRMTREHLIAFVDGVADCAGMYGASVAGGDSTSTDGPFTVSITAVGYAQKPVARDGAKSGDRLCLFGEVGVAGAGFELLETGKRAEMRDMLVAGYARPKPLLDVGHRLAESGAVRAMIDVSDGVLADAGHLARQAGCRVEIQIERLVISPAAVEALGEQRARELAAAFGDDYALLAAVGQSKLAAAETIAEKTGSPMAVIGRFSGGKPAVSATHNGKPFASVRPGYQHNLGR